MKQLLLILFINLFCLSAIAKEKPDQITEKTPWGKEVFVIPQCQDKQVPITQFGAKATEGFNNQKQIQSAINACHTQGGGTVVVPSGTWFTGYLDMKSNVNLHMKEGATLLF